MATHGELIVYDEDRPNNTTVVLHCHHDGFVRDALRTVLLTLPTTITEDLCDHNSIAAWIIRADTRWETAAGWADGSDSLLELEYTSDGMLIITVSPSKAYDEDIDESFLKDLLDEATKTNGDFYKFKSPNIIKMELEKAFRAHLDFKETGRHYFSH